MLTIALPFNPGRAVPLVASTPPNHSDAQDDMELRRVLASQQVGT